jgi:hypothetical protein
MPGLESVLVFLSGSLSGKLAVNISDPAAKTSLGVRGARLHRKKV